MSVGGALLGTAEGQITIDIASAMRNADLVESRLRSLDKSGAGTLPGLNKGAAKIRTLTDRAGEFEQKFGAVGRGLTGIGLIVTGLFGAGVKEAADFEKGVSAIGAVTGATGKELDSLRQKALQIGKDTAFSATEGASAIEELAKAGVSVTDILSGAADAAVSLAAAADVGIAPAATIIANALNQFGLAGDQATHVADLIAAASSTSSAGARDIGDALSYVGTQAKALNIPIEDTIAAIAAMADQGIVGSRAGTNLAAALASVINPSDKARGTMDALGISVQDANGDFVGMPALLDQVAKATAGMGDAQRQAALDTIFGAEGGRAINALLATQTEEAKAAGKSWDDYRTGVDQAGAAGEQAKKRMDNLAGDAEQLTGTLQTIGIVIGGTVTPALRFLMQGLNGVLGAFLGLPGPIQKVLAGVIGVAGGLSLLAGGALLVTPKIMKMVDSYRQLAAAAPKVVEGIKGVSTAMRGLLAANPWILLIVAALALLALAYKTNLLGFADKVNAAAGKIADGFRAIVAGVERAVEIFQTLRSLGINPVSAALLTLRTLLTGVDFGPFQFVADVVASGLASAAKAVEKFIGRFSKGFGQIAAGFARIGRAFKKGGLQAAIGELFGTAGKSIARGLGNLLSAPMRAVGDFMRGIRTGFKPLDAFLHGIGRLFQDVGHIIADIFKGDWGGVLHEVGKFLTDLIDTVRAEIGLFLSLFEAVSWGAIWDGLKTALGAVGGLIADGFRAIPWGKIGGAIKTGLAVALTVAAALGATAWDWLVDSLRSVAGKLGGILSAAISGVAGAAGDLAGSIAEKLAGFFTDLWGGIKEVDWASYIPDLDWSKFVTAAVALTDYVAHLDWGKWVHGAIDLASKVAKLDWSAFVSGAVKLADYVKSLDWGAFVHGAVDIGTKVAKLSWSAFVTGAVRLSNFVSSLDWGDFVTGAVDLAKKVPGFAWKTFVEGVKLWTLVPKLEWKAFVTAVDLLSKVPGLSWLHYVTKVDLPAVVAKAGTFAWKTFVTAVNLAELVGRAGAFVWSNFVTKADIAGKVKEAGAFLWSSFVDHLSWPDVASALGTWIDQLPQVDWPSVDDVKGLIADWLAQFNPFGGGESHGRSGDGSKIGGTGTTGGANSGGGGGGVSSGGFVLFLGGGKGGGADLTDLFGHGLEGLAGKVAAPDLAPITKAYSAMATAVQGSMDRVAASVRAGVDQAQAAFRAGAAAIQAAAQALAGNLANQARTAGSQFQAGVRAGADQARAAFQAAAGGIQSVAQAMAGAVGTAGRNAGSQFQAGIANGMNRAVGAAQSGASRIRSALAIGDLSGQGYGIGSSLGQGINAGIAAWASAIAATAAATVSGAIAAARAEAQARSPSRKTMRLGADMGQGLVIGLERSAAAVAAAFQGIVPGGNAGTMGLGFAAPGAFGGPAIVNNTTIIALKSEEWVRYAQQAETGAQFAATFPGELGLA